MHNIQRKIVAKLLYAEYLGYAAIRPAGVESNHFAYHLDQLVRSGLVGKKDKRYFLTPKGLAYVDRMSQEKMEQRLQPHIVTAIYLTNSKGQVLLYKRYFQPYFHRIGFPLGKTHYEESITAAAERELIEKCDISDVALTHRGMAYIEARQQGTTISKVLYHFFSGASDAEPKQIDPLRGESFWADPATYKQSELMPGFTETKQLIDSQNSLFFTEIITDLGETE